MKQFALSNPESLSGFTHKFIITWEDLVALGANLTGVIDLLSYAPGMAIRNAAFRLITPFDGGATSSLVLDVGYDGGTTDDPDGLLDNYQIHLDGTEVFFGLANGADFATLKTGYVPLDSGVVQALFTVVGADLDALTTGELVILLALTDLAKL